MSDDPLDIPKFMTHFASWFHQSSLSSRISVEDVLCDVTRGAGARHMRKVQRYMSESLRNDSPSVMEDKWLEAGAEIDFEEYTGEFFQQVIDFDPAPHTRWAAITRHLKGLLV